METFIEPGAFVKNPDFENQRQKALADISYGKIDTPMVELMRRLNSLPYCFTLQCCYGHFLYSGQEDEYNLEPIVKNLNIVIVDYRLAYIAFCADNSTKGRKLLESVKKMSEVSPDYIQFGSAEWFWNQQVNSYVIQIEPKRFQDKDKAVLPYKEALLIETVRNEFFERLDGIVNKLLF